MKKLLNNNKKESARLLRWSYLSLGMMVVSDVFASNLGGVASNITASLTNVGNLITGFSYVGGLGFAIGAILKFRAHKEQPTQIPLGTPITMTLVAAALLFLPSILNVTGNTIFGTSGGVTAGPTGTTFGS